MNSFNGAHFKWLNQPEKFEFLNDSLVIETEPETDLWQRIFYGFSKVNAPIYLTETGENFTFSVKTSFETKNRFDQCGVLLYIDDENWVKVSVGTAGLYKISLAVIPNPCMCIQPTNPILLDKFLAPNFDWYEGIRKLNDKIRKLPVHPKKAAQFLGQPFFTHRKCMVNPPVQHSLHTQ